MQIFTALPHFSKEALMPMRALPRRVLIRATDELAGGISGAVKG